MAWATAQRQPPPLTLILMRAIQRDHCGPKRALELAPQKKWFLSHETGARVSLRNIIQTDRNRTATLRDFIYLLFSRIRFVFVINKYYTVSVIMVTRELFLTVSEHSHKFFFFLIKKFGSTRYNENLEWNQL